MAGEDYSPRVFLDGVEVAVTGRAQVLRDGGTRRIPTERGMLTLPHRIGDPDRIPRLRKLNDNTTKEKRDAQRQDRPS